MQFYIKMVPFEIVELKKWLQYQKQCLFLSSKDMYIQILLKIHVLYGIPQLKTKLVCLVSCLGKGNENTLAPWKESYDQPRQHIKKQRHYFVNKGPSSQGCGFSSGHVWMWELDFEESWAPKNWCFWTVVLEKTWESLGLQGDPTSPS